MCRLSIQENMSVSKLTESSEKKNDLCMAKAEQKGNNTYFLSHF